MPASRQLVTWMRPFPVQVQFHPSKFRVFVLIMIHESVYNLSRCFRYSNGFGIVGEILGENHILNLPNSYMGLIFFPLMLLLGEFLPSPSSLTPILQIPLFSPLPALPSSGFCLQLALLLSFLSTITSAYLIYILVYVLKTICLVCLPVHFLNVLLFILYTIKWRTAQNHKLKEA